VSEASLARLTSTCGLPVAGVQVDEFAAVEIGEVLAVGRPGQSPSGGCSDHGPMGKDPSTVSGVLRSLRGKGDGAAERRTNGNGNRCPVSRSSGCSVSGPVRQGEHTSRICTVSKGIPPEAELQRMGELPFRQRAGECGASSQKCKSRL
jgi:hypothetical protein